jgi:hypothetical protein
MIAGPLLDYSTWITADAKADRSRHPWAGYDKYQGQVRAEPKPMLRTTFSCDGRTRCSQMTSCDEATYFLKNCPGVKMDGDNDGIPCEQQWCR